MTRESAQLPSYEPPGRRRRWSDSGVRSLLSAECRPLRRALRPLVWVALEEVALDAVVEDGRLVARTSARQVAERLGIDPGTAAAALRILRGRGLVGREREKGPAGRFGLSVYQLRPIAGLSVVQPCAAEPFVVSPPVVQPGTANPCVASPCVAAAHVGPPALEAHGADRPPPGRLHDSTHRIPPSVVRCRDGSGFHGRGWISRRPVVAPAPARSPRSVGQCPGQEVFDLGVGVVVTAPVAASPEGWQVSVLGWAGGGDGMVVGGVMAVGMGVDGGGWGWGGW